MDTDDIGLDKSKLAPDPDFGWDWPVFQGFRSTVVGFRLSAALSPVND